MSFYISILVYFFFVFFFFSSRRRHTRFSRDWSSDVCSSDLASFLVKSVTIKNSEILVVSIKYALTSKVIIIINNIPIFFLIDYRSEERRVGKECRSRWSRDQ